MGRTNNIQYQHLVVRDVFNMTSNYACAVCQLTVTSHLDLFHIEQTQKQISNKNLIKSMK